MFAAVDDVDAGGGGSAGEAHALEGVDVGALIVGEANRGDGGLGRSGIDFIDAFLCIDAEDGKLVAVDDGHVALRAFLIGIVDIPRHRHYAAHLLAEFVEEAVVGLDGSVVVLLTLIWQ